VHALRVSVMPYGSLDVCCLLMRTQMRWKQLFFISMVYHNPVWISKTN